MPNPNVLDLNEKSFECILFFLNIAFGIMCLDLLPSDPFRIAVVVATRFQINWTMFGQKLKGSFYGGSFRRGVRVPIGVLGGGLWGRVQVGGGVGFPEPASQCAFVCQKEPLASPLPFGFFSIGSPGDKTAAPLKGGFGERALVPVFIPGEHANVPSFRFSFWGNIRMYPRFGFRSGGTSAKTTLLENHPFGNPRLDSFFVVNGIAVAASLRVACWPCFMLSPTLSESSEAGQKQPWRR